MDVCSLPKPLFWSLVALPWTLVQHQVSEPGDSREEIIVSSSSVGKHSMLLHWCAAAPPCSEAAGAAFGARPRGAVAAARDCRHVPALSDIAGAESRSSAGPCSQVLFVAQHGCQISEPCGCMLNARIRQHFVLLAWLVYLCIRELKDSTGRACGRLCRAGHVSCHLSMAQCAIIASR